MRGVPRVVITPGEQTLDLGETSQYSASVTNVRGQGFGGVRRSWSSSDPSVADIDANGLVTTRNEGDTDIIMTVTADPGLEVRARVPLHVAVCDGIFRVPEWLATGDVEHKANGFVAGAQANYSVEQISTGTGVIKQIPGLSNADSTVWEGAVTTGSITINNLITFPVPPPVNTGRTTESKSGEIPAGTTARLRLTVKRPSEGGFVCTYNFEYGDYFTWEVTNNQGAPAIPKAGPVGIARLMDQAVGTRTPSGGWVLGSVQPGSGIPLPAKAFSDLQSGSDYTVGTTIGASMIIALGGAAATYGQATFVHILSGSRP
jgi:hypothetical protein